MKDFLTYLYFETSSEPSSSCFYQINILLIHAALTIADKRIVSVIF